MGARCRDKVLDDQRPGKGGDQRIAVHVQRVGAYGGANEVAGELLTRVDDDRFHGAAFESALADASRSSPPCPTSMATAMISAPVAFAIQPMATEVSKPPE